MKLNGVVAFFRVWPVRTKTTVSASATTPWARIFLSQARVTAEAAQQPRFGYDFGLGDGDLGLGDIEAEAASDLDDLGGLAPGGRSAGANGSGAGVGLDRLEGCAFGVGERRTRTGSGGLDDGDARLAGAGAELVQLAKAFAEREAVPEIAAGNDQGWSGTFQSKASAISKAGVFWPSRR